MQLPKNLDLKPAKIFKIVGLVLLAIIIIVLAFRLVGSSISSLSHKTSVSNLAIQSAPGYALDAMSGEMAYGSSGSGTISLSSRNVVLPSTNTVNNGSTVGDQAEAFEMTEYSANIETRQLKDTCDTVAALKAREDVIFESASQYERGCHYSFKVKRDSAADILAVIKTLNPKELVDNTYTIKNQIDDYTSATEILQKKMDSIDETLANAVGAYDEISKLATKTQDVESLAKIIDSKINIIERLTVERLNISTQLEALARSKSDQLDRLEYAYFNINVVENKFIDGQSLKDSWKAELKSFVLDINKVIQDITINLVAWLFMLLQYIIYLFIILIIAKYGWQLVQYIWKK